METRQANAKLLGALARLQETGNAVVEAVAFRQGVSMILLTNLRHDLENADRAARECMEIGHGEGWIHA